MTITLRGVLHNFAGEEQAAATVVNPKFSYRLRQGDFMAEKEQVDPLYWPRCQEEMAEPLVCGDCGAVICRRCGTPLEEPDQLGIG
jgi:hypothetical protein